MSSMSELDLCITEIAKDNEDLRSAMIEEINDHINGILPWSDLSDEAKMAYEMWETDMREELNMLDCGFPHDDDHLLAEEELEFSQHEKECLNWEN